jgi:hypothetical protein
MRLAAIELDDVAVALARDGALVTKSPGFALLDGDSVTVGDHALSRARLEPRMVNTRFWDCLSNDAIVAPTPAVWTYADLARAHIASVWKSAGEGVDGLVLAVPGHFDRQRLGLLLGVTTQLAIPVRGMVDGALAACGTCADSGLIVHVAVYLHRTVVTGIALADEARRVFTHSLEGHGLVRLYEILIALIADLFVRTTRFDPLHRAESEQAIYERLPQWLALLVSRESLGIEMAARDGGTHVIRLTRSQVEECTREFNEALRAVVRERCSDKPFVLELGASAAIIPGLADTLRCSSEGPAVDLPPGAGALGALRRASWIVAEDRRNTLTVSLPRAAFSAREQVETPE